MTKNNQSIVQMTRWCDEQEKKALDTIDHLFDTKQYKKKLGKKALLIATNILNNIEALRSVLEDELTK